MPSENIGNGLFAKRRFESGESVVPVIGQWKRYTSLTDKANSKTEYVTPTGDDRRGWALAMTPGTLAVMINDFRARYYYYNNTLQSYTMHCQLTIIYILIYILSLTKLINPISTILNYTIIHYTMLYYMCLCYIYYQETAKGTKLHHMGGFAVLQGVQERHEC